MFSEELEKIDWEETTKAIYSKTESDEFIAGGISILKEKKGEKDNAHY